MSLTSAERRQAIEYALTSIEDRFIERAIRAAVDYKTAVKEAWRQCRWWGHWGPDMRVDGEAGGIKVIMPDGRTELITWDELARSVRGPEQMKLF